MNSKRLPDLTNLTRSRKLAGLRASWRITCLQLQVFAGSHVLYVRTRARNHAHRRAPGVIVGSFLPRSSASFCRLADRQHRGSRIEPRVDQADADVLVSVAVEGAVKSFGWFYCFQHAWRRRRWRAPASQSRSRLLAGKAHRPSGVSPGCVAVHGTMHACVPSRLSSKHLTSVIASILGLTVHLQGAAAWPSARTLPCAHQGPQPALWGRFVSLSVTAYLADWWWQAALRRVQTPFGGKLLQMFVV